MANQTSTPEILPVTHYSKKELAKLYGVCNKTLSKWMQPFLPEIGEKQGRFYTVAQVRIIFEKLGMPGNYHL